jgi:hypothetical protein
MGGCWGDSAEDCIVGNIRWDAVQKGNYIVGFRLVRNVNSEQNQQKSQKQDSKPKVDPAKQKQNAQKALNFLGNFF